MFVHSFNLSAVHCAIILSFSWHLKTCKKRNSIHLNSYTLFSCILRKIIISTVPGNQVAKTAFPQLKEISFKMTITLGGGVSINCIYYSIFSKLLCLFFCQIPSPYHDSHMQINCGSPEQKLERLPYFTYISEDKRLLLQTFPGTFRPKLKLV